MVLPTFCHLNQEHQATSVLDQHGYYNVNCVTDLDEDGGNTNTVGYLLNYFLDRTTVNFTCAEVSCQFTAYLEFTR